MNKIEIGEYVRTDNGLIGKIKRIELDKNDTSLKWYVFDKKRADINIVDEVYINKPYIVNHSPNIIDLIEVGDYVNGEYVIQVSKELNCVFIETTYYDELAEEEKHNFIKAEEIKSIVTHEQFKNIEYKVGE